MRFAHIQASPFKIVAQYDTIPDPFVLPSGNAVHGVGPGFTIGNDRIVSVEIGKPDAPGEFYQVTDIKPVLNGDVLTMERAWSPVYLGTVHETLSDRIDARAEQERLRVITPGAAQAIAYLDKAAEAEQCIADQNPDPKKYPLLAATIGIDGDTVAEVAAVVIKARAAWKQIAAPIETARMTAKKAIRATYTVAEAEAAFKAVEWPPHEGGDP